MEFKKALIAVVAGVTLAFSATSFAAAPAAAGVHEALSQKNAAIAAAKLEVPSTVNYFGTKDKGDTYDVKYQDPDTLDYYDVTVTKKGAKVQHVSISGSNFPGSVTINKTPEDVKAKILADYPTAKDIVVTKEADPNGVNLVICKATFTTDKFAGVAQLNPATCLYGHRELSYLK